MIDYIKYTVDGKTYSLVNTSEGVWQTQNNAPSVAGNYNLLFEISENGLVTYVDSSHPKYAMYLTIAENVERVEKLINHLPPYYHSIEDFKYLCIAEDDAINTAQVELTKLKMDRFITSATADFILNLETFLGVKGVGTLNQRKSYLIALYQKGGKLNETKIKTVVNSIIGANCNVVMFGADEVDNINQGHGFIRVQVFSPDSSKDSRYEDVYRALKPLVPSHLKLAVVKYFATWGDIATNYASWASIKERSNWETIKNFLPPQ